MTTPEENSSARLQEIGFIMKDLLKVSKVVSMYPEDNPLPQMLKRSFAEKLVSILEDYGDIRIRVEKEALLFDKQPVFEDRSKEEALAGMFFGAGITEFTFRPGLDVNDVYRLLAVIKEYRNSTDKSRDLAAAVWESGIAGFSLATVEDIALQDYDSRFNIQEYMREEPLGGSERAVFGTDSQERYEAMFQYRDSEHEGFAEVSSEALDSEALDSEALDLDDGGDIGPGPGHPGDATAAPGMGIMSGAGAMQTDGDSEADLSGMPLSIAEALGVSTEASPEPVSSAPNTTLILNDEFRLSEEEEATVREMLAEDAAFDPWESTREILKEMLLQETEMNAFYETVTICERVIDSFIGAGKLLEGGQLLHHLGDLESRLRRDRGLWAERLKDARISAGSRDRLAVLTEALNANAEIGVSELKRYLDNFDWQALSGITDLMGDIEHKLHREAVRDYLTTRGRDNIDIVAKGIYDKRWFVARDSVTILAGIGDARAFEYLRKVVDHNDSRVRKEAVSALKDSPSDDALGLLRKFVYDEERDIRKLAVESLVARHGPAAFDTVTEIINDESFAGLDQDDQRALLRAFSIVGGEQAVAYLSTLVMKPNPFRDADLAFYREAAFEALTHNRSEKCEKLLVKLSGTWRPDIRQQASAALQRRREVIFGDEQ